MDNQQERLVSLEYVAGLVAGEGSFCFNVARRNGGKGLINPVFQLFMTDVETIDLMFKTMQAHNLPGYYYKRNGKGNIKDQYGIRVHGVKRVKRHCDVLLPLLTGEKARAAQIMADYCNHRLSLHPKAGYGPKDVAFVAAMREVNGQRTNNKVPLEDLPRILRDFTLDMESQSPKDIVRSSRESRESWAEMT